MPRELSPVSSTSGPWDEMHNFLDGTEILKTLLFIFFSAFQQLMFPTDQHFREELRLDRQPHSSRGVPTHWSAYVVPPIGL